MKKLQVIFTACAAVCAISVLVSTLIIGSMAVRLDSQTAYKRWAGDGEAVAQLSAFMAKDAGLTSEDMERSFKSAIDSALVRESISPANESARIYALAYSAERRVSLSRIGEYGKTVKSGVSAMAVACGGDYFLFHPLKMLSGHYFSTSDILNDMVVIDNDLAWQFFGSPNVVGKSLIINGRECFISGVSEDGRSGEYSEFYGDVPRVYMSYSFAEEIFGDIYIETAEITLPNPVGGFAEKLFSENLPVDDALCEIKENSARFTDKNLRKRLFGIAERGVRTKPIAYPYFENTAVMLTDAAANVYIFKLVPIIILSIIACAEVIILYIKRRAIFGWAAERIKRRVRDAKQNRKHRKSV